jgi:DNA mismatch endonuclease (patch repair protein)
MARVRSAETGPEVRLRRAIFAKGARYRLRPKVAGTPDFAFVKQRVAVFVDGCFWHGCPIHYRAPVQNADFWRQKLARNVERDDRVNLLLADAGWTVVRVWEHEIRTDLASAVERVLAVLAAIDAPASGPAAAR